jgi:hypothetical protein
MIIHFGSVWPLFTEWLHWANIATIGLFPLTLTCAPTPCWPSTERSGMSRKSFPVITTRLSPPVHLTRYGPQQWWSALFCAVCLGWKLTPHRIN